MTIKITWLTQPSSLTDAKPTDAKPTDAKPTDAKPSFAELRPRGSRSGFSVLSSLGLHVAAVWMLSSTVEAVKARRALLHADYPERALLMSPASMIFEEQPTDPERRGKSAAAHRAGDPASAPDAAASPGDLGSAREEPLPVARQGKRFMFPVELPRKPASQVLVRMEVPPELKLNPKIAVPQIFLWQLPAPVKPKETLVAAAHREEQPVRERETPTVNPQMTARNQEQELAELRHADAPPVPAPAMPLPVSNTTPIRLLAGLPGNTLPNSTGPVIRAPEEVHVISVPELPVPQPRVVPLPLGNQSTPPLSFGVANAGGGGRGNGGEGTHAGASADNRQRGAAADGDGASKSTEFSGPTGGAASDRGRNGEAVANANGGIGPAPLNAIRIVRPKEGKYSVVVLGSANLDAYPEAAGILSGKLVYTVYLRTGGRKEWILQYCLPKAVEQAVRLRGSAVPLEAPYPFTIYRPNLTLLSDPDYVIVHGFITATGRFEHLSAIGDIDSASRELLISALDHWEFRPASRDGEPSAVEIALIIPREPI